MNYFKLMYVPIPLFFVLNNLVYYLFLKPLKFVFLLSVIEGFKTREVLLP